MFSPRFHSSCPSWNRFSYSSGFLNHGVVFCKQHTPKQKNSWNLILKMLTKLSTTPKWCWFNLCNLSKSLFKYNKSYIVLYSQTTKHKHTTKKHLFLKGKDNTLLLSWDGSLFQKHLVHRWLRRQSRAEWRSWAQSWGEQACRWWGCQPEENFLFEGWPDGQHSFLPS